ALIDARLALYAGCPLVDSHEYALVSRVAQLIDVEVPMPPGARPLLKECQDLRPSIHVFLCPSGDAGHVPLAVRVKCPLCGHWIAAARRNEHLTTISMFWLEIRSHLP